jgi:NAD(P)H-quinone oxidoreductase subunit 5
MVDALSMHSPLLVAVVLLTNALTMVNLVRVFRQVFLDVPHPKTRRTPEVIWLMALPMLSLAVVVLLTPVAIEQLRPLHGIAGISPRAAILVVASSAAGLLAGCLISLDKFWSRSVFRPLRTVQDLLAFDFYTDRIYRSTIVAAVAGLARLTDSFDRVVVNGIGNRIGQASMASAEGLKLGVSGQLQSYVLTVVMAIVLLFAGLSWLQR